MTSSRFTASTLAGFALVLVIGVGAAAQESQPAPATTKSAHPAAKVVLENALEAVGGKEALDGVKSSRVLAQLESPMGNSTMELFWMKTGACLMRTTIPGMGVIEQGTDGKTGWGTNPMTGKIEKMAGNGMMPLPLADRTNLHHMVPRMIKGFGKHATIDRREYAGRPCYVVLLSKPKIAEEGDQTVYFDVETHLPVGVEMKMKSPMGEQTVTQKIGSWIERDGIKIVERLTIESPGQPKAAMRITDVEFNKVNPKVVAVPESLRLAP